MRLVCGVYRSLVQCSVLQRGVSDRIHYSRCSASLCNLTQRNASRHTAPHRVTSHRTTRTVPRHPASHRWRIHNSTQRSHCCALIALRRGYPGLLCSSPHRPSSRARKRMKTCQTRFCPCRPTSSTRCFTVSMSDVRASRRNRGRCLSVS